MQTTPNKIIFIFNSTNNKILDIEVKKVKTIIKSNFEVVTGPVCFKHQRQLIAYIRFNSTIDRLMKLKPHKLVKVQLLT